MMQPESVFLSCRHGAGHHRLHIKTWNGAGRPLFMVHALTRSAGDFDALANALEGRRILAPDMIGRGQSPWVLDSALYITPHYVDDCLQLMDFLKIQEADWVGTSMGGLIGMMLAAQNPGRIRKLVLNDVGPFLPLSALQRIGSYLGQVQRFADMDQAYRYCRTVYAGFGLESEEGWRGFTQRSLRQQSDGSYVLHYDPAIGDMFKQVQSDINLWPFYDLIRCPTLVLRGAQSDVLTEKDAEAMTQRGPKATLVTFPHVGHAPALESAEQIKVVTEFLKD